MALSRLSRPPLAELYKQKKQLESLVAPVKASPSPVFRELMDGGLAEVNMRADRMACILGWNAI